MKKSAQLPSQYSYSGYDPSMDNLGLLPGVAPEAPEQSGTPSWLVPLGVAAGGLAGYSLLRGAGRGLKGLLGKLRGAKKAVPETPWNWEMEMMGRGGRRYQSVQHPGEAVGHGYGPGPEATVKQSSVRPQAFANIITRLGQVARDA
jgi:hypothetical protein